MPDKTTEQLFFELHEGLAQQGPGSRASTHRGWNALAAACGWVSGGLSSGGKGAPSGVVERRDSLLVSGPAVIDIGCGPGRQTLDLLDITDDIGASITAVDTYPPFLEQLADEAARRGFADKPTGEHDPPENRRSRLTTVAADMNTLPFQDATFDAIWSEGAIYLMGFETGLQGWRRLLRPGGGIALTELSWLTENPPAEARTFWEEAYPGVATVDTNLATLRRCGYRVVTHFTLPAQDWWNGYYAPLKENARRFSEKYRGNETAEQVLSMEQTEMDLFARHWKSYGYVFYIATV